MTHPTDDELKDLAHSAYEEAMSFGLSVDTFLRYFKGIRNRALLAEQARTEPTGGFARLAPNALPVGTLYPAIYPAKTAAQPLKAEQAKDAAEDAPKLWLWKNFVNGRPEYWAFDNPYPINLTDGDPQTLGEPCGYAIFKPSRQGRFDVSEEQVLAAVARAAIAAERKA